VGSSAVWSGMVSDAMSYASSWFTLISPVVAAFIGLGIVGLAVVILRRATA